MNLVQRCRRIVPIIIFALVFLNATPPAHAVSKEMIQLQTQVQQLIDSLARLQSSNDQQMGVLKDLVQQTVDSVNKMAVTVNGMQLKVQNQTDAQGARSDQLSGQVQALNDSLDELKARMGRMEKSLSDVQNQTQSTNAIVGSLPGANGAGAGNVPAAGSPLPAPGPAPGPAPEPGVAAPPSSGATPPPTASSRVPGNRAPADPGVPVAEMYRAAYNDYMAGRYPLATSEFNDLIKAHPDDNLAGNGYFYLGEIDGRTGKPTAAVKSYDQLLEHYPGNVKIPAARLHKGESLIALKQTDAGMHELRALVQRYPNSAEAAQARTRLSSLARR